MAAHIVAVAPIKNGKRAVKDAYALSMDPRETSSQRVSKQQVHIPLPSPDDPEGLPQRPMTLAEEEAAGIVRDLGSAPGSYEKAARLLGGRLGRPNG